MTMAIVRMMILMMGKTDFFMRAPSGRAGPGFQFFILSQKRTAPPSPNQCSAQSAFKARTVRQLRVVAGTPRAFSK